MIMEFYVISIGLKPIIALKLIKDMLLTCTMFPDSLFYGCASKLIKTTNINHCTFLLHLEKKKNINKLI